LYCYAAGVRYDSVLLNLYPDGASGMGWHQDPQEAAWAEDTAVVSVGAPRTFKVRDAGNHDTRWSFKVEHGKGCVTVSIIEPTLYLHGRKQI
jgi:alkylated DNA repair dioxygenase AlkB